MLKSIIRTLLQKFVDDIDSDNCNITMEQQSKIISVLSNIANPDQRMSKIQACDYLGVSRATFDNYVRDGFIPKGIKQEGFKELSWQSLIQTYSYQLMDRNNLNYLVYVHTNKINGKKYVGQSSNIVERWRNGGKNYFSSIKFFRAIQKYGWENFTHEILYENLNKEAANKIERDLIRKYDSINNGYNIQEGGYTSLTQNSLDKMSKSLKQGYLDHPERRQKISEKLIGRKNSEETKRKKSLNSAKAKLITIDGEIGSIRFWALKIGMSHTTLNYRLKTHGEDNLIQFIKSKLK